MDDKKKLHILSAIAFMDLFAVGLLIPLFSNHVRELGGTYFTAGLLSTVYSGVQLFSGPLVGSWSDIRGRKSILTITLFISSICYFVIGITSSLYVLFFLRFILGFMKHTQTLCKAFIADLLSKEKQSAVHGYTTSVSMIGFIVGPILGGHLSEFSNGFFYVCLVTSILFFINILLTSILPQTANSLETGKIEIQKEILKIIAELRVINWKTYWSLFATKFLHAQATLIFFFNISLILKEYYGVTQKTIGYTIAFQSCIGTVSAFFTGWVNTKYHINNEKQCIRYFYGFTTLTISLFLLCMVKDIYTFFIALIPLAISNAFLRVVEIEMLLAKSKNDKGSLVGTSNSLTSLARLIAPICSGIVSDLWGQSSTMYIAAMFSFIGMFIAGFINVKTKNKLL